jgi:hypothetical protein
VNNDTPIVPDPQTNTLERDEQLRDGLRLADAILAAHGADLRYVDLSALVLHVALEWLDDDTTLSAIRTRLDSLRLTAPSEVH